MKDVNELLFRCSSLGHLMASPVSKADKEAGNLSEGAKTHCVDVHTAWRYNRREEAYSKYLTKGTAVEEDSITLLSLITKKFYKKNEELFKNEFICGTPDLFLFDGGTDRLEVVEDTKSSYDIFTFRRTVSKPINPMNFWQITGYMALTGAPHGRIRHCLVNAPADVLDAEKRQLNYRMGYPSAEDPSFVERCKQIERNMIYDMGLFRKHNPDYHLFTQLSDWSFDIPATERLHTFEVERNEEDINLIYQKVAKAREFIKTI